MPKMVIVTGNCLGSTDISGLDFRAVDIPIMEFDGDTSNFPGDTVCISDYLTEGAVETVFISLKQDQPIDDMTDFISLSFGDGGGVAYSVYKDSMPVDSGGSIFQAPWTVYASTTKYGLIGKTNRDNIWDTFDFLYINRYANRAYDFVITNKTSDISIRCPDSVRQGLFIIVACDSPEQPYVDFTCTLSGHTSPMTKLMQNTDKTLRLQCGSDEGASELLLEVESGGATASKAITVIPYTPVGPGSGDNEYDTESKVTDISLLAFPDTVAPGGYSIILISVNGEGDYSQRITAEISGHTSAETQYFSDGYFCNIAVGKDETAESILVTITSAQDPSVSASAWVNVDHSGDTPTDPGTDEERLQRAFWKGFAAGIPG